MSGPAGQPRFVVDTNVAVYAALPLELIPDELERSATATFFFLAFAEANGAELRAPYLFLSEVANVVWREAVARGLVDRAGGRAILKTALSYGWTPHLPDWDRVYEVQEALARTRSLGDAEFLVLAESLGCELVTAAANLIRATEAAGLSIRVVDVRTDPLATGA